MIARYPLLLLLLLGGCMKTTPLEVRQFMLRDQKTENSDEPLVKMEKERHLHGAVSMQERGKKLGQYYTLLWSDPEGVGNGEVELVFQYQQGASGSLIKRMQKKFPAADGKGKVEFAVIGEDYIKRGKVLSWKATLTRGGREIATRKSYLWE